MMGATDRTPSLDPDDIPPVSGADDATASAVPGCLPESDIDIAQVRAAFGVALHMHQPMVLGETGDLSTAPFVSNLEVMGTCRNRTENYKAARFVRCYKQMAEIIPRLAGANRRPRIMLDYSGTLLWGLARMGRGDVLDALRAVTTDARCRRHVEWLGTLWGHAVVPSTPVPDIGLHIRAWRSHFASLFGREALGRVRGFSPPEMHLPNHPDVAYAFVAALLDAGYTWVLVQADSVETPEGEPIARPHLPHRLVARDATGRTATITALIKTGHSDVHRVGLLQPMREAHGLDRVDLAGRSVPPLVSEISDGENGAVMMHEFADNYIAAVESLNPGGVVMLNGTEYLALIEAAGADPRAYPVMQPRGQRRIFAQMRGAGRDALERALREIQRADKDFRIEGTSWSPGRSWEHGYRNVLDPMRRLSAAFHEAFDDTAVDPSNETYRTALLHLLLSQTSCYRYWGRGRWTDYAKEICRRGMDRILANA